MILDNEQKKIFINFVETFKDIIRDKRSKFIATHLADGSTLIGHPLKSGNDFYLSKIDFEALCTNRLFDGYYLNSPDNKQFIITLEALEDYKLFKNEKSIPLKNIENDTLDYIKAKSFSDKYPKASQKWLMAEDLFLSETEGDNLTTIGHLCRESLQEFSDELLQHKSISKVFQKSKTIAKIKYVFKTTNNQSNSLNEFVDALLSYWGTVSNLVQKQVHYSQREGSSLKIDDARRIIFHTAIVMYEIDKTIL